MTPEEQALWSALRKKHIHAVQFYRQKPIAQYVVDFYCAQANLVVEVDGKQHAAPDHHEADKVRDEALEALGLKVLGFSNRDVRTQLNRVVAEVSDAVLDRLPK